MADLAPPALRYGLGKDSVGVRGRRTISVRTALGCGLLLVLTLHTLTRQGVATPLRIPGLETGDRQDAIDSIPTERLTNAAQNKIVDVVNRPSLYRRLPSTVVKSDPDLYLFLVRHPEVVVNMWDLMGVTKVEVNRTGQFTFDATDGAGTTCSVELLYGDRNIHVMYSEGHYEGPLLRRLIRGRCVLILNSEYAETDDGSIFVTSRLDMFVRFENIGAELLARTLHPLVGRSADHNFIESTRFLGEVSAAAETKANRLQRFTQRMTKVDPEVRERFDEITAALSLRAIRGGVAAEVSDRRPVDVMITDSPGSTTERSTAEADFLSQPD